MAIKKKSICGVGIWHENMMDGEKSKNSSHGVMLLLVINYVDMNQGMSCDA